MLFLRFHLFNSIRTIINRRKSFSNLPAIAVPALGVCLLSVACSSSDRNDTVITESARTEIQTPLLHQQSKRFLSQVAVDSSVASSTDYEVAAQSIIQPNKPFYIESGPQPIPNTENYQDQAHNPLILTSNEPTSTFSIDVDTGSYANTRRFINTGQLPPKDAVRVEELINYFNYSYPVPGPDDAPFSVTTEIGPTPWNDKTHLLHVGLKGYEVSREERSAVNLVFLVDVSGSMAASNKLGLLKPALKMLVNHLTDEDTVSIAVYAGASGTVLPPTSASEKSKINRALQQLRAGGSTNGEAGIQLAYDLAADAQDENSTSRVILVTDGDFNVGLSSIDGLKNLIEEKRKSGISLTTLGFGTGNYNDHLMEQLADTGNGLSLIHISEPTRPY